MQPKKQVQLATMIDQKLTEIDQAFHLQLAMDTATSLTDISEFIVTEIKPDTFTRVNDNIDKMCQHQLLLIDEAVDTQIPWGEPLIPRVRLRETRVYLKLLKANLSNLTYLKVSNPNAFINYGLPY